MKQYKVTLTINVFIDAESEDDVQQKLQDMDFVFQNEDRNAYDTDLIDWEIEELDEEFQKELDEVDLDKAIKRCMD